MRALPSALDRARCGAHSALAPRRGQARPAGPLLESHSQIRTDCPTGPSEKRGRPDPDPASEGNLQAFSSPFLGSRQAERAARRTRATRRARESSSPPASRSSGYTQKTYWSSGPRSPQASDGTEARGTTRSGLTHCASAPPPACSRPRRGAMSEPARQNHTP